MFCETCGNEKAYRMQKADGPWVCDRCGDPSSAFFPDVYFKKAGEVYENLTDKNGVPVIFDSKGGKARFLRENNLSEAGDRVHGASYSTGQNRDIRPSREANRQIIKEAIRKARETIGKNR